ncbi:MAG: class I SAM-dependent methyltransferase [Clostridiales bacterium]|nr:class I SAM-dependent methyltransferase [Clostridiales bacterium]
MSIARPGGFEVTDKALEKANYKMGSRILDIGCGEGDTVNYLNKMGLKAEGIDINLAKIDDAKKNFPGIDVKFGDGGFLDDYMSYTFDGIIAECALSTMLQPDEALHEAYCVLKKGGRLIITDYYEKDPDSQKLKAIAIEAARQSRLPHNEGDCDAGTPSHFTDFCFEGAFFKEPLIRMVEEELGLHVLSFEDAGIEIDADDIYTDVKTETDGKKRKLGYFVLVAQKAIV